MRVFLKIYLFAFFLTLKAGELKGRLDWIDSQRSVSGCTSRLGGAASAQLQRDALGTETVSRQLISQLPQSGLLDLRPTETEPVLHFLDLEVLEGFNNPTRDIVLETEVKIAWQVHYYSRHG